MPYNIKAMPNNNRVMPNNTITIILAGMAPYRKAFKILGVYFSGFIFA